MFFIDDVAAQISGCTDPLAINYNPSATKNDGSCIYPANSVIPELSMDLVNTLSETSGLINWNDCIWTFNDNDDINIYALDTLNGNIVQSCTLTGTLNKDWEEISQDNDFIYIGDFGNNSSGNRTDLKILRVRKNSILVNPLKIDAINFSYSDQTDFNPAGSNNTDFDCEAFIVSADSIYLFTKQWISRKTSVYSLPKSPGTYIARKRLTCDVHGLITGAVYLQSKKLIALCGYNINYSTLIPELDPFIFLLYDFTGYDFFSGNKRKLNISLPYHQVESITTTNGLKYYISNEYFSVPPYLTVLQKLHILNLDPCLKDYIESLSSTVYDNRSYGGYSIYPVPAGNFLQIKRSDHLKQENYSLINDTGQVILSGYLSGEVDRIDISSFPQGLYILKIGNDKFHQFKVIKN